MNIRTRLLASAALAVAATALCGVLLWIGATRSLAADSEQEKVRAAAQTIAGLLASTQQYAAQPEPRVAEQWRQRHAALTTALAVPVQSGDISDARRTLRTSAAELPPLFLQLTELEAQPAAAPAERNRALLANQLLGRIHSMAEATHRWSSQAAAAEQAARRWLRIGGSAAVMLLLAITLVQLLIVWRSVLRPLAMIEKAAAAVEGGDLTARCANTARDELGRVARRFDAMTTALGARNAELNRTEQRLRAIADNMPALITQFDASERYTFVNAYIENVLGVQPDAMVGRTLREVCGSRMYAGFEQHIRATLRGDKTAFETQLVVAGALRHYQSNYIPDRGDDGVVRGFYGISFDVTERKRSEMRQAASELRLRTIADNLPVLIAYIDSRQHYRFCNAMFEKWFGIPASQAEGRSVAESLGPEVYEQRRPFLERALAGERVEFYQSMPVAGTTRHLHAVYLPHQENGVTLGLYALITDVTASKQHEAELSQLARFDSLTGLPNRRQFDERLADAMARSLRTGRQIAVLFLDIDHFKAINDSGGHAAGDAVLKEMARRLKYAVRATDTVARLAGDEFVVILEAIQAASEAEQVARKLVFAMRDAFVIDGKAWQVTTSIGVAVFDGESIAPDELMARADTALYEAKSAGRDGYRRARPTLPVAPPA